MERPLGGRVVLVTGGGRGLGEATCRVLAGAGALVMAADIKKDRADQVSVELRAAGCNCSAMALDVGDEESVRSAVEDTLLQHGRLDAVVNNAGIDVTLPLSELSVSDWDRIIAVNLRGPFLMSKFALPAMEKAGRGQIVNIVSTASKRAWANASAYHASKWGLLGFSHALHTEARQRGIKVTAIVAGGMRTPFQTERFPDIDGSTLQDPQNVARAILFVLTQPDESVIPELMVVSMNETSWP